MKNLQYYVSKAFESAMTIIREILILVLLFCGVALIAGRSFFEPYESDLPELQELTEKVLVHKLNGILYHRINVI